MASRNELEGAALRLPAIGEARPRQRGPVAVDPGAAALDAGCGSRSRPAWRSRSKASAGNLAREDQRGRAEPRRHAPRGHLAVEAPADLLGDRRLRRVVPPQGAHADGHERVGLRVLVEGEDAVVADDLPQRLGERGIDLPRRRRRGRRGRPPPPATSWPFSPTCRSLRSGWVISCATASRSTPAARRASRPGPGGGRPPVASPRNTAPAAASRTRPSRTRKPRCRVHASCSSTGAGCLPAARASPARFSWKASAPIPADGGQEGHQRRGRRAPPRSRAGAVASGRLLGQRRRAVRREDGRDQREQDQDHRRARGTCRRTAPPRRRAGRAPGLWLPRASSSVSTAAAPSPTTRLRRPDHQAARREQQPRASRSSWGSR